MSHSGSRSNSFREVGPNPRRNDTSHKDMMLALLCEKMELNTRSDIHIAPAHLPEIDGSYSPSNRSNKGKSSPSSHKGTSRGASRDGRGASATSRDGRGASRGGCGGDSRGGASRGGSSRGQSRGQNMSRGGSRGSSTFVRVEGPDGSVVDNASGDRTGSRNGTGQGTRPPNVSPKSNGTIVVANSVTHTHGGSSQIGGSQPGSVQGNYRSQNNSGTTSMANNQGNASVYANSTNHHSNSPSHSTHNDSANRSHSRNRSHSPHNRSHSPRISPRRKWEVDGQFFDAKDYSNVESAYQFFREQTNLGNFEETISPRPNNLNFSDEDIVEQGKKIYRYNIGIGPKFRTRYGKPTGRAFGDPPSTTRLHSSVSLPAFSKTTTSVFSSSSTFAGAQSTIGGPSNTGDCSKQQFSKTQTSMGMPSDVSTHDPGSGQTHADSWRQTHTTWNHSSRGMNTTSQLWTTNTSQQWNESYFPPLHGDVEESEMDYVLWNARDGEYCTADRKPTPRETKNLQNHKYWHLALPYKLQPKNVEGYWHWETSFLPCKNIGPRQRSASPPISPTKELTWELCQDEELSPRALPASTRQRMMQRSLPSLRVDTGRNIQNQMASTHSGGDGAIRPLYAGPKVNFDNEVRIWQKEKKRKEREAKKQQQLQNNTQNLSKYMHPNELCVQEKMQVELERMEAVGSSPRTRAATVAKHFQSYASERAKVSKGKLQASIERLSNPDKYAVAVGFGGAALTHYNHVKRQPARRYKTFLTRAMAGQTYTKTKSMPIISTLADSIGPVRREGSWWQPKKPSDKGWKNK